MVSVLQLVKTSNFPQFLNQIRRLSLTSVHQLKQINEIQQDNCLTISANIIPSDRESLLLKNDNPKICPVCASGLDIKHTDVLILSQFVRPDGCMLPKRVTGLCNKQQRRISSLVTMAQKAGLMPNLNPSYSKKDPKTRHAWKKFNKYFDESTINT